MYGNRCSLREKIFTVSGAVIFKNSVDAHLVRMCPTPFNLKLTTGTSTKPDNLSPLVY